MYYLSSRANVDDLKTIENKSSYVSADNMPDYVKGAFISMEDERFYKHHGFDVKVQHEHCFQRLGIEMFKVEVQLRNKL